MKSELLLETERFLHEQIPLTRAMGVRLESYEDGELVIHAPLEPNHNHLGTAFGGSLSAIATLTGYSLLWLLLEERDAHIVIREGSIRYHRPVTGEIQAHCAAPDETIVAEFRQRFQSTGKARIRLQVRLGNGHPASAVFEGEFVAMR